MLKPVDSATREQRSLDGLWRFLPDSPELKTPWSATLPGNLECPVPASYNDLYVTPSLRDHVGKVWYQRKVFIPRGWKDTTIILRVDAATHEGEVYVGDKLLATHVGGYTPFEADLTDHVTPGDEVRITIGVNNILTNECIPPGRLVTSAAGVTQQKYWHDFFNYAGLARSVRLVSVPQIRVDDITVVTDVKGTTGTVKYDIVTAGQAEIQVDLCDRNEVVASASSASGTLEVPNAHLWQPGNAFLYTLRTRLMVKNQLVDEYRLAVGIRSVRIEGYKFLINDKPFYFKGYGRHEDAPVKGKGHDDAWMVHDFELMKWSGANSFRTSHYPYAEDVLEYADRQGVVVIDETAAVGLNLNIGGGLIGDGKAGRTFSEEFAGAKTQAAHKQAIRELVARDKNHPCVVMWCITNEPGSGEEGAREYFEPLVKLTKELDPTRPVTFTNILLVSAEQERVADLFDVVGMNRYYGWYTDTGDLKSAAIKLLDELVAFQNKFGKPLVICEYGADTASGLHSLLSQPWSEEYQAELYDMYHEVFDKVPAVQGEQVWNFADFSTGPGVFRVDGNKKGIFTRDRRPKMAAHALRKRWTGHIAKEA